MKRLWWWAAALAVAAIVAVCVALLARARNERQAAPVMPIVVAVERRTLALAVEATGQVEPAQVVEVKSRASGKVRSVMVDVGDDSEEGALLAEIDPRDVQNALDQAEADLDSARVRRRVSVVRLERVKRLMAEGLLPEESLDTAEDEAASAVATALRAETNLRLAREMRSDVTIRAPIAGTILARQIEPGQIVTSATGNVSGGSTLFKMANLAAIRVRAKIDETDISRIAPGQPASVTVEALASRHFQGEVEKVEPLAETEQNVTRFPILVRLENPERVLMPGMSAEISLQVDRRENVLVVPNGAVVGMREVAASARTLGVPFEKVRAALRGGELSEAAATPGLRDRGNKGVGVAISRTKVGGGTVEDNAGRLPGLLFVESPSGPEPRRATFGLTDWESTEVLDGVAEGERVYLVSVVSIANRQRDAEWQARESSGVGGAVSARSPGNRSGGRR